MIKQDIRKVLLSPFFYISIVAGCILMLMGAWEDLPISRDIVYLHDCGSGMFMGFLPLLSGLAIADLYCIESKSGYHYSIMVRGSKLQYCLSKVFVGILTGFLVSLLATPLFILACFIIEQGHLNVGEDIPDLYQMLGEGLIRDWIQSGHCEYLMYRRVLLQCFYSSLWPSMALCISIFTQNKYVVIAGPFVLDSIWTAVVVGLEFYYLSATAISPDGRAEFLPYEGIPFRIAVILFYYIVEGAIFTWGVLHKLK